MIRTPTRPQARRPMIRDRIVEFYNRFELAAIVYFGGHLLQM